MTSQIQTNFKKKALEDHEDGEERLKGHWGSQKRAAGRLRWVCMYNNTVHSIDTASQ